MTVSRAAVMLSVFLSVLILSHANPNTQSLSKSAVIERQPGAYIEPNDDPNTQSISTAFTVIGSEPGASADLSVSLIPVKSDEEPSDIAISSPVAVVVPSGHRHFRHHFHHMLGKIHRPRHGCHHGVSVLLTRSVAPEKTAEEERNENKGLAMAADTVQEWKHAQEEEHKRKKREKKELKKKRKAEDDSDSDSDSDDDDDENEIGGFFKRIWKMLHLF